MADFEMMQMESVTMSSRLSMMQHCRNRQNSGTPKPRKFSSLTCWPSLMGSFCTELLQHSQQSFSDGFWVLFLPMLAALAWRPAACQLGSSMATQACWAPPSIYSIEADVYFIHSNQTYKLRVAIIIDLTLYRFIIVISMKGQITLIAVLLLIAAAKADLLPHRLRIVDSNRTSRNYFVRGNVPITKSKNFQMEELRGNLSQLTQLKRYRLIVVSLLNFYTSKESKLRYIEENYFQKNPKVAQYRSRVVLGSFLDPTKMANWAASFLNKVGNLIDFDKIEELVEEIHSQLHKKGNKNIIVYLHCQAGVDRTGYVAGAYGMKYLRKSLAQVMDENYDVLKGHRNYMVAYPENGLQWFCFNLGRTQKDCEVRPHVPKSQPTHYN